MKNKNSTSFRKEIQKLAYLGIPLVASQLIYASSGFIGTAMVARLGEDALAASVLVSSSWLTLSVFFFGILNVIGILVSHQFGDKNFEQISKTMGQGYFLCLLLSIPIILLLLLLPSLLSLTHQTPKVLLLAGQYVHALIWTIPGLMVLIVSEHFLAAVGHGKVVLVISLIVVPIEIPLIYLLIFGKAGLPACGIAGVGYGFAVTYSITACCLVSYLFFAQKFKKYAILAKVCLHKTFLIEILKMGVPIGFSQVIEISTFAFVAFWIANFGTTILAAHQIVMQYLHFVIPLLFSMAQAVSIRLGHAIGEQNDKNLANVVIAGIVLGLLCNVVIAVSFCIVPDWYISLDIDLNSPENQTLIKITRHLFGLCALLLIFENIRIIGCGALRGLKDTNFVMYSNFLGLWVAGLSSAYVLAFVFQKGGFGVWWGLIVGMIAGGIIVTSRLYYLLRK